MVHWILRDGQAVQVSMAEWLEWFATRERIIHQTHISSYLISTVFLGIDHGFGGGQPVLWETMIFYRPNTRSLSPLYHKAWESDLPECLRYTSMEEARLGHWHLVNILRNKLKDTMKAMRKTKLQRYEAFWRRDGLTMSQVIAVAKDRILLEVEGITEGMDIASLRYDELLRAQKTRLRRLTGLLAMPDNTRTTLLAVRGYLDGKEAEYHRTQWRATGEK